MGKMDFLVRRPIAHRGLHDGNQSCLENSLSAFEAAIEKDFAIELDVQLSADERAIVFHDETLDRLTAETGPVAARTAEELRAISLGTTSDHIPTLTDTLELVAGRVPIVIEMKDNGERNSRLARAVADDLQHYGGPVAVMSFEHDLLAAFKKTGSAAPFGLTAEGIGTNALAEHDKALDLGISFASYHVKGLPNAFVKRLRGELSMPVITWTVREPADVEATRAHADQMTFEGFDPDR
jgi:glycerophosphoryl diester phosphodiesterase